MIEPIIYNLCKEYEKVANCRVKFVNEKKVRDYWMPKMHIGTTKTISNEAETISWYSEIWINNECVFRENLTPINNTYEEWAKVKQICMQKLLTSIFCYGIAGAREILKQRQEIHN